MGVPVLNVTYFESSIGCSVQRDLTLVIMANVNSDSQAVSFIHKNFHIMDVLANGVNFYLPGYGYNPNLRQLYKRSSDVSFIDIDSFQDSHLESLCTEVIHSPRLGPIYFKEAEFADFVMEFTRKIPSYEYLGCCQLILLPLDSKTKHPIYKSAKVFDLDRIIDTPGSISLDSFIYKTFLIIRGKHKGNFWDKLFFWKKKNCIDKISKLYDEATTTISHEKGYVINIQNYIIYDLEKYLNWSLNETFYFISYSSSNIMLAELLKQKMQEKGLYVWIAPDGIPQGRDYSLVVPTVLRYTKNFVLLLTRESANSRWVKRELDIAISNDASTTVRVLFGQGYSINDLKESAELQFYLNKVQIKYTYEEIINDEEKFASFISD